MTMQWLKEAVSVAPAFERDKFGLPRKREAAESPLQVGMRKAQLRRDAQIALTEIFAVLKRDLSLAEAQALFAGFVKPAKPRKRGQRGESDPELNRRLMTLFDQTPGVTHNERAVKLAEHCDAEHPGLFGNSRDAIMMKIRRLAKRRSASHADVDVGV